MSKKSFLKGAAILGVAGIIVKLLGAIFRIPLGNMIGATGMSYYTPAYYIYTIFVVIATSGIPVAISKMVSERITVNHYGEAHRVFRYSMYLMLGIGTASFLILFIGAGWIASINGIPESKYSMMAVAPALIVVPVMAAYRGYFQGMQNMKPTAFSQVIEQFFRVGVGLFLGYTFFEMGDFLGLFGKYKEQSREAAGAAGATFGGTIGSLAGLLIILIIYALSKKVIKYRIHKTKTLEGQVHESGKKIVREILLIAVPITIGASIMPIMNFIEVPIIVNRLISAGWDPEVAKNLYGQIGGFATPIINLPQVLTMAMAMSLVPLISAKFRERDKEGLRYNTALGLRVSLIIGLPCAFGIAVLSEPIMLLLYPGRPADATNVAPTLSILAIGVIFLSVVQTVSGILQGVGRQMVPVKYLGIGIIIKIVLTWVLVGVPALNIKGAAIGTTIAYMIVAILNVRATRKYTGAYFDPMQTYIKPAFASMIMLISAWVIYYKILRESNQYSSITLITILISGIIYVIMLFVTKTITVEELERLPGGRKMASLINKLYNRRNVE